MKRRGIFPGTFDPVTLGHIDVVERSLHIFDHVIVAVARSERNAKKTLFGLEERIEMFRKGVPQAIRRNVEVTALEGLLVDFARARGVQAVVRGLRFFSDFEYEFQMATMNQKLWPEFDSIFLMPTMRYSYLNSSLVKEIARNGGPLRGLVSPHVARRLRQRFEEHPDE
jgi:pantetheine-phosphate adenylyltransferase